MRSPASFEKTEYKPGALVCAAPYTHWLLRIALASVFLFHGINKFMGGGVAGFANMMELPLVIAYLVAIAEILGGIGILAGPFINGIITRLAAVAMIPVLLGAIIMVHLGRWHFMATDSHPMGGMEFQVVLLLLAVFFLVRGNDV